VKQDFSATLCVAKWRALRAEKQRMEKEKELSQVDRVLSPLHGNHGDFLARPSAIGADAMPRAAGRDFFGAHPKKLPPFFSAGPPGVPPRQPPPHGPLSRKGRGVNDLGQPVAMLSCISPPEPSALRRLFLGGPKKSPPFLAPQKSQKSRLRPKKVPVGLETLMIHADECRKFSPRMIVALDSFAATQIRYERQQ
jgi:hypothetical protein